MAISRASDSSIQDGLPKFNDIWDVTTATSAFDSLGTVLVGAATTSLTFSNIPQTYAHLQFRWSAKHTTSSVGYVLMRVGNGSVDTDSNYSYHTIYGDGSTAAVDTGTSRNFAVAGIQGGTSNVFAANVLDILDYSNTDKFKTTRVLNGVDINGSGGYVEFTSSSWRSFSAINYITFFTQEGLVLDTNSTFSLYGIK